jgi:hypothetical protein
LTDLRRLKEIARNRQDSQGTLKVGALRVFCCLNESGGNQVMVVLRFSGAQTHRTPLGAGFGGGVYAYKQLAVGGVPWSGWAAALQAPATVYTYKQAVTRSHRGQPSASSGTVYTYKQLPGDHQQGLPGPIGPVYTYKQASFQATVQGPLAAWQPPGIEAPGSRAPAVDAHELPLEESARWAQRS